MEKIYSYDGVGRLAFIKVNADELSTGKRYAKTLYEYDKNGNLIKIIRKGGVRLVKQKFSLCLEEDLLLSLMKKYGTDNKFEANRLALLKNVSEGNSEKKIHMHSQSIPES